MISADMAHAYQPNFPSAYEPEHKVLVNQGPVIKVNANIRYASNSASQARFIQLCEQADVPYQQYSHRTDIGCGSTIGPMTSARLGINTVDVGCPMWAMHSIRESAGVLDHQYITRVFTQFFS
jgi:aspartyl aminopeptidase